MIAWRERIERKAADNPFLFGIMLGVYGCAVLVGLAIPITIVGTIVYWIHAIFT